MRPNCRSSGVATADAIVSGLAPGRLALTLIVGNSTCGSGATGSSENASTPASASADVSSVVATGRRMKGAEMLTACSAAGDSSPACAAAVRADASALRPARSNAR